MWSSIGILAVAAVIIMLEAPALLKKGWKKEIVVFSILLLLGTGLSIAENLQVDIPNPMDAIAFLFKPLSDLIFGWLE